MSFTFDKVRSKDFLKLWYFITINSEHRWCQHISILFNSVAYLCEQILSFTAHNVTKEAKHLQQIGFTLRTDFV